MDLVLSSVEVRVLGALIEKEITTPEYYPMSLNALTNACNQKSNRDPVMELSENDVFAAIESLKDKRLGWQFSSAGGRVPKYEHNLRSLFSFSKEETAVICVLMLRGPQTIGEIRMRSDRMCSFATLDETESTIRNLISRNDGPFVIELERQPGRKESRFMHLFAGQPHSAAEESNDEVSDQQKSGSENKIDRVSVLETEVALLRTELNELREQFFEFKKQLE